MLGLTRPLNSPANWTLKLPFADAFQRLSARERLLVMLALMAALIMAPLKAYDWADHAQEGYLQAALDLAAARQSTASGHNGLAGQLADTRSEIRGWSWMAPSASVGQVILQDEIAKLAKGAGMTEVDVRAIPGMDRVGGVDFVKVELTAAFSWPTLTHFLSDLAAPQKGFMVETMTIQGDAPARVRMVLRLPLTTGSAPP